LLQETEMDRISGPYKGYYVAACALPMGELGDQFIGYAKVCASRPRSCWDGPGVSEHSAEQVCNAEDEAVAAAEAAARKRIDELARSH
jgi:hypothetical protein